MCVQTYWVDENIGLELVLMFKVMISLVHFEDPGLEDLEFFWNTLVAAGSLPFRDSVGGCDGNLGEKF